jgi:hypothetical protein
VSDKGHLPGPGDAAHSQGTAVQAKRNQAAAELQRMAEQITLE